MDKRVRIDQLWIGKDLLQRIYPAPWERVQTPYYECPVYVMDNNERVTWRCKCGNVASIPPSEWPPKPCPLCGATDGWRKL